MSRVSIACLELALTLLKCVKRLILVCHTPETRGVVTSLTCKDAAQLDFRNPESFYHDVNSVAGLLKQFFRDLPDPLLTHEHYQEFIEAARMFSK
jgi:hypothetical protein